MEYFRTSSLENRDGLTDKRYASLNGQVVEPLRSEATHIFEHGNAALAQRERERAQT